MMFAKFRQWIVGLKDGPVDWEELEAELIQADLGMELAERILEELKQQPVSARTIREATIKRLRALWPQKPTVPQPVVGQPEVWWLVGVNGAGKTTTLAKLGHAMARAGRRVHLVGADTFRAAASEQLARWAERVKLSYFVGVSGSDPAAAAYQGVAEGLARGAELILVDTAGRLHTKEGLMRELEKVGRVLGKQRAGAPQQTLLVVDGTNGANALAQAREFHRTLGVTGLIVTKLDSSAKGGVIAAIKQELGLETFWVGRGEGVEDLVEFDPQSYAEALAGVA